MTDWPLVTLSEVAKFSSGGTPSKSKSSYWNGDIPWVSPKDMKFKHIEDAADKITRDAVAESAARIVGTESVLVVARSGILSHSLPVSTIGVEVSFNQDLKAITPDASRAIPEYVYWILKGREREIISTGVKKGATVHSLSSGFLESIQFRLPPLPEQRRIANLLDRSADICRETKGVRERLRDLIRALFNDTFGDPRANPNGWPVVELDGVAKIGSGITKGRKLDGQITNEIPYVRVANVQDGHLDLSEIKMIAATDEEIARYSLRDGDLLMTEGGDPDKLGRCAVWREKIPKCIHQNHIFRVRVTENLLPEYAAAYIQSDVGKSYFLRVAKRTTGIASINRTQLGALPILVPPMELQARFVRRLKRIEILSHSLDRAAEIATAAGASLAAEVFG